MSVWEAYSWGICRSFFVLCFLFLFLKSGFNFFIRYPRTWPRKHPTHLAAEPVHRSSDMAGLERICEVGYGHVAKNSSKIYTNPPLARGSVVLACKIMT